MVPEENAPVTELTPTPTPKPEKQPDYRRLSQKLEKELQQAMSRLETTQEQLSLETAATKHARVRCEQQQQYYQQALLTIVENLKVMMRTIAILAGKVE